MDLDAYRRSPVGSLAPIEVVEHAKTVAYHAFAPDPLADNPELTAATWNEVVEAGRQLGQLSTLATERLPDPLLIARPTIRREAVSTSALEGTFAPPADVLVSEMEDEPSPSEAVREVLNFIQATDHALASPLPV